MYFQLRDGPKLLERQRDAGRGETLGRTRILSSSTGPFSTRPTQHMEAYRVRNLTLLILTCSFLIFVPRNGHILHALSFFFFQSGPLRTEFQKGLKEREAAEKGSKPGSRVPESEPAGPGGRPQPLPRERGTCPLSRSPFPFLPRFSEILCCIL